MLLGKRIGGRNDLKPQEDVEFLRGLRLELPEPFHHGGSVAEFEDDRPAVHHAPRMGAEEEAGYDAEVSASASERPEQVGVLRLGSGDKAAVGEHDIRLDQIVHSEAVLAAKIAVAAAQRESGDAGCRDDPEWHRLTEGVSRVIDISGCA